MSGLKFDTGLETLVFYFSVHTSEENVIYQFKVQ